MVGLRGRDVPESMPPGRALRPSDVTEIQLATLPGAELSGAGQAMALAGLGAELTARDSDVADADRPHRFVPLPERLDYADIALPESRAPMWALVGVGGDELEPLGPLLSETPTFVVAGPPRSGRSTALATMARSLLEAGSGLLVVAPRRSPLRALAGQPGVAAVLTDADTPASDFRAALRAIAEPTGVVLIDDAELLLQSEIGSDLGVLARGAAGDGWGLVVGGNGEALSTGIGGWINQVRRNRAGLIIAPQSLTEGEAIGTRLSRGLLGTPPVPGRAHLHLGDSQLIAVQIPNTVVTDPASV
jgi:S-DNA-T family DNA segregation ATPase FtsK/SpoIIIE